jgi:hypothetical protein
MYALSWNIDKLGRLNDQGRELYVEIKCIFELLSDSMANVIQAMLQDVFQSYKKNYLHLSKLLLNINDIKPHTYLLQ